MGWLTWQVVKFILWNTEALSKIWCVFLVMAQILANSWRHIRSGSNRPYSIQDSHSLCHPASGLEKAWLYVGHNAISKASAEVLQSFTMSHAGLKVLMKNVNWSGPVRSRASLKYCGRKGFFQTQLWAHLWEFCNKNKNATCHRKTSKANCWGQWDKGFYYFLQKQRKENGALLFQVSFLAMWGF